MSITLSPSTLKRIASVTTAAALAGSATLPALVASAEGEPPTPKSVTLPKTLTVVDKPGYTQDAITLPVVEGVKWKKKIGEGSESDAAEGSATAQILFTTAPTAAKTAVTVTAVADSGYELPSTAKAYVVNFNTARVKTTVKAPALVVSKSTKLVTGVTVPYAAGVTYTVGNTAISTETRKPVLHALTSGSTVTITAEVADDYIAGDALTPVTKSWTLSTKTTNATAVPVDAVKDDRPGKADFVILEGVAGVIYNVAGKDIAPKPGVKARVATKGATSVAVKYKAASGYTVTKDDAALTFTLLTDEDINVSKAVNSYAVTITPSANIKAWKFGKKVIAFPKGATSVTVTLPADGTLTAEPVAGYKATHASGSPNDKGVFSFAVTKAAAITTGATQPDGDESASTSE